MGATIPQIFSDSFINEFFYKFTGSVTARQFPDVEARLVRFKAPSTNVGSIFLGNSAATVWYELDAGDDTGGISTANLKGIGSYLRAELWILLLLGYRDNYSGE